MHLGKMPFCYRLAFGASLKWSWSSRGHCSVWYLCMLALSPGLSGHSGLSLYQNTVQRKQPPCICHHSHNLPDCYMTMNADQFLHSSVLTWSCPFFFFFFLPQHPELSASFPPVSHNKPSNSSDPPCWLWEVSAARRYDKFLRMHTQFSTVWWREVMKETESKRERHRGEGQKDGHH